MKFEPIILPKAEREIEKSYHWYEDESGGLGGDFLFELRALLSLIGRNPLAYPVVHRDLRRALMNRFPHSLFYVVKDDLLVVVACVHQKRHPNVWKRRR